MTPRFHRRSLRLSDHDYCRPGAYFVTAVTEHRRRLLSRIVDGETRLLPTGRMVAETWRSLPLRFPTVRLDAFVVMPDHVHGVLWLTDERADPDPDAPAVARVGAALAAAHRGETVGAAPPMPPAAIGAPTNDVVRRDDPTRAAARAAPTRAAGVSPDPVALGAVMGAFKSLSTVAWLSPEGATAPRARVGRLWQRDYVEHVIRSDRALAAIRAYVAANPARWRG